jgi:hypothetical protein
VSQHAQPDPELMTLIWAICDGSATVKESDELAQRLNDEDAARLHYLRYVSLVIDLESKIETENASSLNNNSSPPNAAKSCDGALGSDVVVRPVISRRMFSYFSRPALRYAALVALGLYGSFVLVAWNLRPDRLPSVAVVRDTTDVQWSSGSRLTATSTRGKSIHPGEALKIESGTMELELKTGAKLVVEGPADWSVDDKNRVSLRAGKLLATVPAQAVGFSVETPTAKIVDLGTEFGVEVDDSQNTNVHVRKGEVSVRRPAQAVGQNQEVRLSAGRAIRLTTSGEVIQRTESESAAIANTFSSLLRKKLSDSQDNAAKQVKPVHLQPNLLGGLQLWLKADEGVYSKFSDDGDFSNDVLAKVGDRVQAWRDFSDYRRHAIQSIDKAQPTLIQNQYAGDSLYFSGDDWLERAGEVLPPKNSEFTIFVVFHPIQLPDHAALLFGQFNDREGCASRYLAIRPGGRFEQDEFWSAGGEPLSTAAASIVKDRVHVVCALRDGAQRSVKIHTSSGTTSAGDSAAEDYTGYAPDHWRIGSRLLKDNAQSFNGTIAEILAFDRAIDAKSHKHLEAYLLAKYLNKASEDNDSHELTK